MSIKIISKHRGELMAIAMLWIAFFHSQFPITNKFIRFALVNCGYGGACVFSFLSAYGLYFSYKKDNDYGSFIKKRLYRIVPFCLVMIVIDLLIRQKGILDGLFSAFGLYAVIGLDLTNWYTSYILLLYFLTPLYLKVFKNRELKLTIVTITITILISSNLNNFIYQYVLSNLTLYLLGFFFAYLENKETKIPSIVVLISFVIGWGILFGSYHFYRNDIRHIYPFIILVPSMCMLASWVFDKLKFIQKPFKYLGKYTYQFYLLHELVLLVLYNNYAILYRPGIHFDFLINAFALAIAIVLSIVFKELVDNLMKRSELK